MDRAQEVKKLGGQQAAVVERLIRFGGRSDIQIALLAWAGGVCDRDSLAQLKSIYQEGALSMRLSSLAQTRDFLRLAKRCVMLSDLRLNAEAWIKRSIEGQ